MASADVIRHDDCFDMLVLELVSIENRSDKSNHLKHSRYTTCDDENHEQRYKVIRSMQAHVTHRGLP